MFWLSVLVLLALPFFWHWTAGVLVVASFTLVATIFSAVLENMAAEQARILEENRRREQRWSARLIELERLETHRKRTLAICDGLLVVASCAMFWCIKKLWDSRHGR